MVLSSPNDISMPDKELRRLMFDVIKSKGDDIFMVDALEDVEVTYQELFQNAASIAMFLNKAEVGEGTTVGILSDVVIKTNFFVTGVWFSGGTLCPMNPVLKPEEIRQLLDVCGAKVIYCQGKYLETLEAALALDGTAMEVTVISDGPSASCIDIHDIMNEDPSDFEVGEYDEEESISHILFTSGTTGVPKGVMISSFSAKYTAFSFDKDAFAFRTHTLPKMKGIRENLVNIEVKPFMCTSPLYWISYIALYLCVVTQGNKMIVPRTKYRPGTNEPDVRHLMDCIQKYQPYNWFTAPSVVLEMSDVEETYDMSSLNRVGVGGSNLLSSQRQRVCERLFQGRRILFNMYGSTEVGVITGWPPGEAPDHDSPRASSIGTLASGVELKVIDPTTGEERGPGEIGEFVVKSVAIMKGYINENMPERYTRNDWYHMGDLGWYDEDGYLYFSSRLKEIMKYRGFQIAPAEIEMVAVQHPGVQEVCVVGRPHVIEGERPTAFVVRKDQDLTEQELMDFVHERVGDPKKLRGGVFFVDEIPKSGVGKTLRRELVKILEEMDA